MPFDLVPAWLRRPPVGGALAATLAGLALWATPVGDQLARWSFDGPTVLSQQPVGDNVVLVTMDEASCRALEQEPGPKWDRRLHAQWIDYLRADGASLIVFDVFLDKPGDAATDAALAQAIRAHGRVVLGGGKEKRQQPGGTLVQPIPPAEVFREVAAAWGVVDVDQGGDGIVRRFYGGLEQAPSLAWQAAALAGASSTRTTNGHLAERWLRYYGPAEANFLRVSYHEVTNRPAGFFRGRTVFIGAWPMAGSLGDQKEAFRTPWQRRTDGPMAGVELHATSFLNLTRGDGLRRWPAWGEALLLLGAGVGLGAGLIRSRSRWLVAVGAAALALLLVAVAWGWRRHVWFAWGHVALAQMPVALAGAWLARWRRLQEEKARLEAPLEGQFDEPLTVRTTDAKSEAAHVPAIMAMGDRPHIPDHELIRQVGRGAYGDVWLARDALGAFHAVKIVWRMAFAHQAPFEREFRGLQKFTPVSRQHPGLVHVLHAGLNAAAGYFFYVMEAGDDEQSGPRIVPQTYTPRNLARELRRRGPLPWRECVELGMALADAVEFLHRQGLIHRDIKPANIIFVRGQPKLADVGLVTDIASRGREISYVGTEGFLPPEGPGTAAGDVFALGRVLEEMLLPRNAEGNPTGVPVAAGATDASPPARLLEVIRSACATDLKERFPTAQALRDALGQMPNERR